MAMRGARFARVALGLAWLACGVGCTAAAQGPRGPETPEPGDEPRVDAAPAPAPRPAPAPTPAAPDASSTAIGPADAAPEAAPPSPAPADASLPRPLDAAAPSPPSTGPVSHRFLKGFSGGGSVAIVGKNGEIEWEIAVAEHEANDAWLVPGGNVLFAFKSGCREVNPAKQTVWEFRSAAGAETHSCQPLPDGNILVGESRADGTSFLYEMTHEKKIVRTVTIKNGGGSHNQFRQVRKTPEGTYLVVQQRGGGKAQEVDAEGKILRTFPCGRFVAIRLPDGNTLIACGDEHKVIEVDRMDRVVWQVDENEIPGNRLGFVAGLQRLANGNTVICNWAGHSGLDTQPLVFELTRDKKLVWQLKDKRLDMISTIEILDPEAAVDGVMLR
jgi:hypothetical protein